MKKFLMLFVCAIACTMLYAAPQKVAYDKLPTSSQEFLRKYFPQEKVKSVEMDREASWDKYTVYFNSGTQVSFAGGSGDCSEIIMRSGAYVPMGALPNRLNTYATSHYPRLKVVMYQTTADGYRLGLSDKSFLDFDKNGNFVKAVK